MAALLVRRSLPLILTVRVCAVVCTHTYMSTPVPVLPRLLSSPPTLTHRSHQDRRAREDRNCLLDLNAGMEIGEDGSPSLIEKIKYFNTFSVLSWRKKSLLANCFLRHHFLSFAKIIFEKYKPID